MLTQKHLWICSKDLIYRLYHKYLSITFTKMLNKIKEKLYQSKLDTKTSKVQLSKEKSITDNLLGQDFLSDDLYDDILASADFTWLPENRQEKIKKILDVLNKHYKEHQIRIGVLMDNPDEKAELYQNLLLSMQATLSEIDKSVTEYEEFIASEIKKADIALQQKNFNKAYMIANLARNLAKPFASTMTVILKNIKHPFSNTGAKLSKDPRFEKIYNQLCDKTNLINSYAQKFSYLYNEAQDIVKTANSNLAKIHNSNHKTRKQITVDGSPDLISTRTIVSVAWDEISWTNHTKIIGYKNVPIWYEDEDNKRYTYVVRGLSVQPKWEDDPLKMHIVKPDTPQTKYTLFSEDWKVLFDWYFLQYKYVYNSESKIVGIKIKQTTDNKDFIELVWNTDEGVFQTP